MDLRSGFLFAVLVLYAFTAASSQIASKSLARISDESPIVVVGAVEQLDRVSSSPTDGSRFVAHVRVVSYLRGQSTDTAFELSLHVGGIRGFDTELSKGDQAIFFLDSIEAGEAKLHTWGSVARLPSGYFHLD